MVDALQEFLADYSVYGYPVLFAGVMLENAGIPVPGETAVLVAGFLASPAGGERFDLPTVVGITFVAAVLGDNIGYWLGRRFARPYLLQGRRFLVLSPRTLKVAEDYFRRFGLWTIFFARFITGVRVFGALAAGTAGMHWPRFLAANAAGAIAWSATMSLIGYFFGRSLPLIERWLGNLGIGLLVGFGIMLVAVHLLHRRRRRRGQPVPDPAQRD